MEPDVPAGEGQARAQEQERAAQKLEAPRDLRVAGGPAHMQIPAQFGVDAAAADENAVHRGDRNGERRVKDWCARARPLGLGRERKPRPRCRCRVEMFRAGEGGRDAGEAIGHGNIHADNRDVSVDFGPLRKRTRDVERHVGGRGENGVGDELRVLAGQADGAGKAGGGVEPHFAGRADRTGVRRRSCEMINSDRASVRDECPGHSGQLESGLIVSEFAAAQPHRSCACGFAIVPRS